MLPCGDMNEDAMKFVSENTNPKLPLRLTVSPGSTHYSALLCDANDSILCYVHEGTYPIDSDLQSDRLESVVRVHTPFTLVPASSVTDDNSIQQIAREAFTFEALDHLETFTYQNITGIYVIDSNLKSTIIRQLPHFEVEHVVETLLRRLPSGDCIISHWQGQHLFIIGWKDSLKLANMYKIDAPEDAVYYLLSAYQHVGLDPLKDELYISGQLDKSGKIYETLRGFIKDFRWMTGAHTATINAPFEPHLYHHLRP